tara:strand:+ start:255566 stop:256900 length:1335 start_codon:yes stop_codon:yes gene_type:complete
MVEKIEHSTSATRLHLSRRKKILFAAVLILIVGISLEIGIGVLCMALPSVDKALQPQWKSDSPDDEAISTIDDNILGHRPRPNYADHDSRGFRNAKAIERADVVCLGDSQTYGTGVSREDAWPSRLAQLSGKSTYSMAYGGWAPTHSEVLLAEAIELDPRLVIEAFYAGNDLFDCFSMVYDRGRIASHRSSAQEVRASIEEANEVDPLDVKIAQLFRVYCGDFQTNVEADSGSEDENDGQGSIALREFLSQYSNVYSLIRAVKDRVLESDNTIPSLDEATWAELKHIAETSSGRWEVLESEQLRTVFVPEYRLSALNLHDIRIREGLRISQDAIRNISRDLEKEGIDFLVVLIPTKMQVFAPQLKNPSAAFLELVNHERELWKLMKVVLNDSDIEFVDTLPVLRDAAASGIPVYKMSPNGHPSPAGHQAISDAVFEWMQGQVPD